MDTFKHQEHHMRMKAVVLAAALGAASADLAYAQSVDQNPADRGYPAYAQPDFSGYHMGVPQGRAAVAAAPDIRGHQSRTSGEINQHRRHATWRRRDGMSPHS
jgi:hypothetical protein